ncbi:M1 family metallopeptidase [Sphaerimonospora mesophila]|uniref:M1 family metallopeptidase n=1 Tax=Sphaerimonospora mesophila TaxID=37483 RepID=UPI0006E46736
MSALRRPTTSVTAALAAAVLAVTTACSGAVAAPEAVPAATPGDARGVERTGPLAALASGTVGAAGIGDPAFPGDGNGGYDVRHYLLRLSFDPTTKRLAGSATIRATALHDLTSFNLDLRGLTVNRVTVDGAVAGFGRQGDELTVRPAGRISKGDRFEVLVDYSGLPEPIRDYVNLGTYGFVPTADGSFVTSEPNGAKTWFPSNDHPADKATYDFEITVPAGLTAIANGELVGEPKTVDGKTTFVWREKHPMASYLATMTTGRFEVRTGKTAKGVPIYTAVAPAFRNSLDSLYAETAKITDYWSTVFGPYPFSSTGGVIDDYSSGYALENQTKPIYGGFSPQSGIIAHELAHQWFGDSVSITRWKDLWLNEGFASYAEWLWAEHRGEATADTLFQRHYANPADPMWSYPPGEARATDLFNTSVYVRGAMTLHALRKQIGDAVFFQLLKKWTTEHRYGNATTEQFVALAEQLSGKKLASLFDAWLFQPRRPPAVA